MTYFNFYRKNLQKWCEFILKMDDIIDEFMEKKNWLNMVY